MTPTIVIEDGVPILALGGSGGTRIATGATQAALARLLFDLDPSACVSHPRVHTQGASSSSTRTSRRTCARAYARAARP